MGCIERLGHIGSIDLLRKVLVLHCPNLVAREVRLTVEGHQHLTSSQ